ncbi:hypothetical protein E2C01_067705 [Portunus trituberculatus]|uniref:Uncharacterized protein n=1 Tax=Portunus trituberculatus TaxID=210409 RepID=A0A5B7HXF9_PORTR|nr:hypothetical protein [Portunus trituberculatus]
MNATIPPHDLHSEKVQFNKMNFDITIFLTDTARQQPLLSSLCSRTTHTSLSYRFFLSSSSSCFSSYTSCSFPPSHDASFARSKRSII